MSNVTAEEYESTLTVANAIQLSTKVTLASQGNDSADSIGGQELNNALLSNMFASKIAGYLKGAE